MTKRDDYFTMKHLKTPSGMFIYKKMLNERYGIPKQELKGKSPKFVFNLIRKVGR